MKLAYLKVQNLRALDDIELEFGNVANIICGPNASGKSTILESIRLIKAVLAPRLQNEAQTVLVQMHALSQHYPQAGILVDALASDPAKPLKIEAHFKLDDDEVARLPAAKQALATNLLQQQLANNQQNPLDMVSLLSTPQGQQMFAGAEKQIEAVLGKALTDKVCVLKLEFQPGVGFVPDPNFIGSLLIATLERALPFDLALISFFPADRALPPGEVNIQLGGPDAAQLIQSHSLQPQTKYHRLKQTIVNSRVAPYPGGADVSATFAKIFDNLLVGRVLEPIRVSPVGTINIPVRDVKSNRVFDIDYLSSGEKGLILTLLLMVTSVARNGIILIDEPELHLNPALCRRLLPFLIDECLVPMGRQAIICSHSPEILAMAFDDPRCKLFNLVNSRLVSPILSGDKGDLFVAIESLGASLDDILFSRGTLYVEGRDDEKILTEAMASELSKLRIVRMSGRGNVELEIDRIQKLDKEGKVDNSHYFIFDLDRKPTALQSTAHVHLLQWGRYCVENFILDADAIYDVLLDEDVKSTNRPARRGDVHSQIKTKQHQQVSERALSENYLALSYESPGLRSKEVRKGYGEAAKVLSARLVQIKEQLADFNPADWEADLVSKAEKRAIVLREAWAVQGDKLCDAKRILEELHSEYGVRMPLPQFKRRIVRAMSSRHSPLLEELKTQVRQLLSEAIGG